MESSQKFTKIKAPKLYRYNKDFRHRRWLCYCMFHIKADQIDHLIMLLYNQTKKIYYLTVFLVSCNDLLMEIREHRIECRNIRKEKLAYSAHKNCNRLEVSS